MPELSIAGKLRCRRLALLLVAPLLILAAGCADPGQRPIEAQHKQACAESRPQMCTADYQPVCAFLGNKSRQTSNACSACADAGVEAWISGACPDDHE